MNEKDTESLSAIIGLIIVAAMFAGVFMVLGVGLFGGIILPRVTTPNLSPGEIAQRHAFGAAWIAALFPSFIMARSRIRLRNSKEHIRKLERENAALKADIEARQGNG